MGAALGVDIGNVIINHRNVSKDDVVIYNERYSTIPATEDVFEALKKMNEQKFHGKIYLISKCTPWAEVKILQWLNDNNFFRKTGISVQNVFFCRSRAEKKEICIAKGVKYFIDDRLEVLGNMVGAIRHLYLYCPNSLEVEEYKQFLSEVVIVSNWKQILNLII